jgi:hypothetical protein
VTTSRTNKSKGAGKGVGSRLVEDGAGLTVTPPPVPSRFAEPADGLLIAYPPAGAGLDPWHEQRLDAAADLVRWETRLEQATGKALSAWTAVVATAVLQDRYTITAAGDGPALPPDPGAIPPLAGVWRRLASTHILTAIGELLGEVFARFLADPQVISARAWQDNYLEQVGNRLVGVADQTFDLVRDVVQDGIADGASIPTIRDAVQECLDVGGEVSWANRARTIARTETIGAYNGGHLAAQEVIADVTGEPLDKAWLCTIDERTRDSHFRADGQRVPLGRPFRVGGHDLDHPGDPLGPPEEVINCLAPGSLVAWAGQDVLGSTRRRYSGPLVQLTTARGHVLSVTPNHPVLTPLGYLPAGELRPGQQVIASDGTGGLQPQVADGPARVEEFHASLREAGMPERVVGRGVDFHGDGVEGEDVEVVRADGDLLAHRNPEAAGAVDQRLLVGVGGRSGALPGAGAAEAAATRDDLSDGRAAAPAGSVRRGGQGAALLDGHGGEPQPVGFAAAADGQAQVPEAADDRGSADAEFVAHLEHARALGMSPCELVQVDVFPSYHGDVYNLSTTERWYTADGIACHNCRCTVLFLDPSEPTPDVVDRGWRDPAEVAAEIARRAEAGVVRAYDQPDDGLTAAAKKKTVEVAVVRPAEHVVAAMDAIYRASYDVHDDPLLVDEAVVDPALLAKLVPALTAAGVHVGVRGEDHYDPNQRRDENGKWTKRGVGISITVKGSDPAPVSFAAPNEALLRVTFEHELTGSDGKTYRSVVTRAEPYNADGFTASVEFRDADGKKIGKADRLIRRTPEGPQAYHEVLRLEKNYQGLGLGSEFNQRAEAVYRAAGVTHVALSAHSYPSAGMVGGYVWARRGFGWADTAGPKAVAKELRRLSPKHESSEVDAAIAQLQTGDLANMPTPFEVSDLASERFPGDGRVGKAALLQTIWQGVRWLPADVSAPDGQQDDRAGDKLAAVGKPEAPAPAVDGAQDTRAAERLANAPAPAPDAGPAPATTAALSGNAAYQAAAATVTGALPADKDAALRAYAGGGYTAINGRLRGNGWPKLKGADAARVDAQIALIRDVADAHRLPEAVVVHRGMRYADEVLPAGSSVGAVITDPGFLSTSTDPGIAADRQFSTAHPGSVVFELTVPAGHPAVPVDVALSPGLDWRNYSAERELLLPPGSSFRITEDTFAADGRRVVRAEVLPYGADPVAEPAPAGVPAVTEAPRPVRAVSAPPVVVDVSSPAPPPAAPEPLRGNEAHDAAIATVDQRLERGTPEFRAMLSYISTGHEAVNNLLRGVGEQPASVKERADVTDRVDLLRALADQYRLSQPIEVHRGITGTSEVLPEGSAVGAIVTDSGFMSTTTNPRVAEEFSRGLGSYEDDAVFRLVVPAGHPALPVTGLLGTRNGEDEVILPPGSSFRITGDERDSKGRRILTGEVLSYAGGASAAAAAVDAPPVEAPAVPEPEAARTFRALARPKDGDAFLAANFDPKALNNPEKEALGYWTTGKYRQVNELQRTGSLEVSVMLTPNSYGAGGVILRPAEYVTRTVRSADEIREFAAAHDNDYELRLLANIVDNLPAALDKHRLPEDMALFRVAVMPELARADPDTLIGSSITDRGYVATSTSDKSAVLVTSEALGVAGPDAVLFEIRTPAGTPFGTPEIKMGTVNGTKLGGYTRVQEVLLNPSEFRVLEVHDDEVDTSGYSLKNSAIVKPDAKAKREPTKVRRIVVERVGDAAPLDTTPAQDGREDTTAGQPADVPAAAPTPVPATDVAPPPAEPPSVGVVAGVKLTPARMTALDYFSAPAGQRSGKRPATPTAQVLVDAGLLERDGKGRFGITAAGRDVLAGKTPDDAAPAPDAAPVEPDLPVQTPVAGHVPDVADLAASGEQSEAFLSYQNGGFRAINGFLRTGDLPDQHVAATEARVAAMDAVFASAGAVTTEPMTVYRGAVRTVFDDSYNLDGIEVGDQLIDRGFTSTTTDPEVAEKFGESDYLFAIALPAGVRAVGLSGKQEEEVLLDRYTALRVTAVEPGGPGKPTRISLSAEAVDPRDATPDAAPDLGDEVAAARQAETVAAEKKAAKVAAAAAKKAAKLQAREDADREARLAEATDDAGVPRKLTHAYLSALDPDELEDLEVHLINGVASGDPLDEARLEDLGLFQEAQRVEGELGEEEDTLGVAGVNAAIDRWREANGRPGLTHPAVGGVLSEVGVPSFKEVQAEYRDYLHQQWLRAEAATNGYLVTPRGERLGRTAMDMFSGKRGVADVMQYATDELLEWFEAPENRRIAWAEFYYERTKAAGFADRAAKARAVSLQINRDRTALKAAPGPVDDAVVLTAAARRSPAAPVEPTAAQLDAYAAGRNAYADGEDLTICPFDPAHDTADPQGLFVLWVRGWVQAQAAAFVARRAAEGWIPDPAADRLGWTGGDVLVIPPSSHDVDPAGRLLARPGDLTVLPATTPHVGDTVTAAGFGPGDPSDLEGRPSMPRTWKSAPHLAPFGMPTGDGRIFAVGSLTARELPLPLLFQPSSGMGHDGSVVVGRILDVTFTDQGIEASGDYLDADATTAPDLAKAVEQAVALTESGLGHVSVDLSDVVGELVDEAGNPVSMEDIFDAWDRGEDPKVLEQVAEGKLIAVTQVATPAFEGAKIELSAAAVTLPAAGAEAALQDAAGADIGVGALVDVETDTGTVRGRVTAVDEATETVTVQPTDADGTDNGDPLDVAPAAVTVVTPADTTPAAEADAEVSLIAAAGPLRPPAAWFEDPKLQGPTALTITDDGRVFGHAALWDVCHVGFSNTCVTPPPSPSGYKHFHTGEVVTEDGSRVAVGNLTLGGRHADVRLAYRSAIEHYDVQGAGAAVVRMYEDEHGIAFAGALTPGVTEEQIYDLRRSPVSGDWRRIGGELEMIGVLSVNAPGFPTPRFATDSSGRTALTAAPSVRPVDPDAKPATSSSLAQLTQRITADVTAAVRAQLREETAATERAARLRGLAAAVRPDRTRQRKLAALSTTVDGPRRDRLAALATTVTAR